MKTWVRSFGDQKCGRAGCDIRRGDPVLVIRLEGGHRVRIRCASCAGEPVPADLPPLEARQVPIEPRFKPKRAPLFASVGAMALDWKSKQAADREPGSDDE